MPTYEELMEQANSLMEQAEAIKAEKQKEVVAEVVAKCRQWGITIDDLARKLGPSSHAPSPRKLKAKYRDPATGSEWSGVGNPPGWAAAYKAQHGSLDGLLIK